MTRTAIQRTATTAGWPAVAGLVAFILGLLMLGATALLYQHARQLADSGANALSNRSQSPAPDGNTPVPGGLEFRAPPYGAHLEDVSLLFKLAKEQGVALGPINYRSEVSSTLPVVMRLADLRLNEDYPKLKAFVAELLRRMPHVYLQEIQIEQGNAAAAKVQATLKLAFVYQAPSDKSRQDVDVGRARQR